MEVFRLTWISLLDSSGNTLSSFFPFFKEQNTLVSETWDGKIGGGGGWPQQSLCTFLYTLAVGKHNFPGFAGANALVKALTSWGPSHALVIMRSAVINLADWSSSERMVKLLLSQGEGQMAPAGPRALG